MTWPLGDMKFLFSRLKKIFYPFASFIREMFFYSRREISAWPFNIVFFMKSKISYDIWTVSILASRESDGNHGHTKYKCIIDQM